MSKLTRFEMMRAVAVFAALAIGVTIAVFLVPFAVILGIITLATDFTVQTRLAIAIITTGVLLGLAEAFTDFRAWRRRVLARRGSDV